jgi:hypothetical protein
MAITSQLAKDVRTVFHEELNSRQRAALLSWLAFTATFGAVRGITYAIKDGRGPFRNLSVGGTHLHHYMWGIGMVSGVGGIAVHGENTHRRHPPWPWPTVPGSPSSSMSSRCSWTSEGRLLGQAGPDLGRPGCRRQFAGRHLLRRPAPVPRPAPPESNVPRPWLLW